MNIEPDKIEQLMVTHLGQQQLGTAFKNILHQLLLCFDQLIQPALDRAPANKIVHHAGQSEMPDPSPDF